jgi:hypothetical protein
MNTWRQDVVELCLDGLNQNSESQFKGWLSAHAQLPWPPGESGSLGHGSRLEHGGGARTGKHALGGGAQARTAAGQQRAAVDRHPAAASAASGAAVSGPASSVVQRCVAARVALRFSLAARRRAMPERRHAAKGGSRHRPITAHRAAGGLPGVVPLASRCAVAFRYNLARLAHPLALSLKCGCLLSIKPFINTSALALSSRQGTCV